MKVFISWSGNRGRLIAEAFRAWLPDVIQSVDPFFSPDIEKGQRWSAEIEQNLKECKVGIICVTSESMVAPWLMFEAGAISNAQLSRVCPLLFQVDSSQLQGPLAQFQATPYSESEVRKLIASINLFSTPPLSDAHLNRTFDRCWPELNDAITEILKTSSELKKPVKRSLESLVEETLAAVRSLANGKPEEESGNHWIVLFRSIIDFGMQMDKIGDSTSDNKASEMLGATINHLRLTLNLAQPKIAKSSRYKEFQAEAKTVLEKLQKTQDFMDIPF